MAMLDVKNLSISFGGLKAVDDFSITIEKGQLYGLIGPNGAGKTTIFNLLTGVYKPDGGRILLDGKDIRDVKLKDLRDEIGIVQQDVYLFAGTIIDNIRYGRPDATDEEVIRAAKAANAHEFIMELAGRSILIFL